MTLIETILEEKLNGLFWKVIFKNLTPETEEFIRKDYADALQTLREKTVEEAIGTGIVKEFIESTPAWYESLSDELKRAPMCLMCGCIPANLKAVVESLKSPSPKP